HRAAPAGARPGRARGPGTGDVRAGRGRRAVLGPRQFPPAGRVRGLRCGLAGAHRRPVPLAQPGALAPVRRLPGGHGPSPPQEHPPGAWQGSQLRDHVPAPAWRRGWARRTGCDPRLLPADLRRIRQRARADPGLHRTSCANNAAQHADNSCLSGWSAGCRGALPARRRHPLRTLLGQPPAPAGPALRDLLLPRQRVLPGAGPGPVRAGRAGRAQAGARLPAGVRAQPPLHRPSRVPGGAGHLVRRGAPDGGAVCAQPGQARAVPHGGGRLSMAMARFPRLLGPDDPFPPVDQALREPDGLLAIGGDLSPERLLAAYAQGIFPWYSEGQPILWWSPDPRMVFRTDGVRLSTRFRRQLRHSAWQVRADTAFDAVLAACAETPRRGHDGTWILPEMRAAYARLHRLGHAHSIEVVD